MEMPLDFDSVKPGYHTIAQIRSMESGEIMFAVPFRANGQFEFEQIPAGAYRLILEWVKEGRCHRLALADQPKELRCVDSKESRISSAITFHGTDNLVGLCPQK